MKIAIIGTGLIGSQVVSDLTAAGHEATGHFRSTGVDLLTGDGLNDAVRGAEIVVDVTNSPTFDDASLDFFRTSVTNLLAAAQAAGVRHIVTLSIVGVDLVPDMAYYRAKALQEDLVKAGPIPYSIELPAVFRTGNLHGIGEVDISARMSWFGGIRATGKTGRHRVDAAHSGASGGLRTLCDHFAVRYGQVCGAVQCAKWARGVLVTGEARFAWQPGEMPSAPVTPRHR